MNANGAIQPASTADFLQHLYVQSQLLVCLQWLFDFQILACIPLKQMISFRDVADLANVPEDQLIRVVRMVATVPFLYEPKRGFVAHNHLSAGFVTKPSFSDALSFLCNVSLPSALNMSKATRQYGASEQASESSYSLLSGSARTISDACEVDFKLRRQLDAFDDSIASSLAGKAEELLSRLDWEKLGDATVVFIGAPSPGLMTMINTLTERFASLRAVAQTWEPTAYGDIAGLQATLSPSSSNASLSQMGKQTSMARSPSAGDRISMQSRHLGSQQNVEGAVVYVLRLPLPSVFVPHRLALSQIVAEVRAHYSVLRANRNVTLILVAWMVPADVGSLDPKVEAMVRCCDLGLHQLAKQRQLGLQDLFAAIGSIKDDAGGLVVSNKFADKSNPTVALEIKYQKHMMN